MRAWRTVGLPGTDGGADRELATTASGARELKARRVRRRCRQQQKYGDEQDQNRRLHVARQRIAQRNGGDLDRSVAAEHRQRHRACAGPPRARAVASDAACAGVTPGFSRPMAWNITSGKPDGLITGGM